MDSQTYRSRVNNPCDHLFWQNRGYPARPFDWRQILQDEGYYNNEDFNNATSIFTNFFSNPSKPTIHSFVNVLAQARNNRNAGQNQQTAANKEAAILQSRIQNPHDAMFWQKYGYNERPQNYKEILRICNYWVGKNKGLEVTIPSPQQIESLKLQREQEKEQRRRQREENPEDELFWSTRGYAKRPDDWQEIYKEHCELEKQFQKDSKSGILKTSTGITTGLFFSQPSTSGVNSGNKRNKAAGVSQTIVKKTVADDIKDLCKLCWEHPLNSVILECAHIATCITCGQKLTECPICRQKVTRVIRTFKA